MNMALRAILCLGVFFVHAGLSNYSAEEPDAVDMGIEMTARQLRGKGIHAFRAGDLSAAETHLTLAVRMDPTDAVTLYCRGLVYWYQGRRRSAEYDFTHASQLEQSYSASRQHAVTRSRLPSLD